MTSLGDAEAPFLQTLSLNVVDAIVTTTLGATDNLSGTNSGAEISSFGPRHTDLAAGEVQLEFDNVAIVIVVEHDLGTMRPGGEFGYAGDEIHSPVSQAVVDIAVSRGHHDLL